ncbi:MAG TPA: OsmC family protein [Chitinophagaceae bacterium]
MKATAKWIEKLAFDTVSDNGHTVRMDTTAAGGSLDSGMSPKKMVLGALSVCSGMDVVGILQKMRVAFTKMEIEAEAEQTDKDPKVFREIHMVYRCDVAPGDQEKLEKAIRLSHDTYCGISAMLKKHCAITHSVELI